MTFLNEVSGSLLPLVWMEQMVSHLSFFAAANSLFLILLEGSKRDDAMGG
jgi:hypothetical protein